MIKHASNRRGASLLSYGLIVGLVSVVALASVTSSGSSIQSLFATTSDTLGDVVNETSATPEPVATEEPSPTPTGLFLDIDDSTLAATLQGVLGAPTGWTLCYEAAEGVAFDQVAVATNCGTASETLQIDRHGSTWSGAYMSEPYANYYSTGWQYPSGFYFTSVSGRAASVYDHNASISSSGDVRIEFNAGTSSERFHINGYKYDGNSTHRYYYNNGSWSQSWNLVDGTNTNVDTQVHIRIYMK